MSLIPSYKNKLMHNVWSDVESFKNDFNNSYAKSCISEESAEITYNLVFARFADTPISGNQESFKAKMFSVIFRFGPSWEKRLDIQKKIRGLSDEDIMRGSRTVSNSALNPSNEPSISEAENGLAEINSQVATHMKRGKLEGYAALLALIDKDVTSEYIGKFAECFIKFFIPDNDALYVDEGD